MNNFKNSSESKEESYEGRNFCKNIAHIEPNANFIKEKKNVVIDICANNLLSVLKYV